MAKSQNVFSNLPGFTTRIVGKQGVHGLGTAESGVSKSSGFHSTEDLLTETREEEEDVVDDDRMTIESWKNPVPGDALTVDTVLDEAKKREVLGRLAQDTQLHKLLTDEQIRSERHRSNYIALKAEHARVKHQSQMLLVDVERLKSENGGLERKNEFLSSKLERDSSQFTKEIERIKENVVSEEDRILQNNELRSKVEVEWRKKTEVLAEEIDSLQSSLQLMKHQNVCLNTLLQSSLSDHENKLEELALRYESRIAKLERDRDGGAAVVVENGQDHLDRIKNLTKQNIQLEHKVKTLQIEIDEFEVTKGESYAKFHAQERVYKQRINDLSDGVETAKMEKRLLQNQLANAGHELENAKEKATSHEREARKLRQEMVRLRDEVTKEKHDEKLEKMNRLIGEAKAKSELEQEIDVLKKELEISARTIEDKSLRITELESGKFEVEENLKKRLLHEQQKSSERFSDVESFNSDLKVRLHDAERSNAELYEELRAAKAKHSKQLEEAIGERNEADEELSLAVKTNKQLKGSLLERDEEVSDLRRRLSAEKERRKCEMFETRIESESKEKRLMLKVNDLQRDLSRLKHRRGEDSKGLRDKAKKYARLIHKLRNKIQLLESRLEEVQLKGELEKQSGIIEDPNFKQLRKDCQDLRRKNEQLSDMVKHKVETKLLDKEQIKQIDELKNIESKLDSYNMQND